MCSSGQAATAKNIMSLVGEQKSGALGALSAASFTSGKAKLRPKETRDFSR